MITYQTENVKMPPIRKSDVSAWLRRVAKEYGYEISQLAYIFCDDQKILEVNRQYLGHDYYTDIITFDYDEGKKIMGDIFISLDTVKSNSEKFKTTYMNELYRVIVHGVLHLCGIKDKGRGQRAIMEKAENDALAIRDVQPVKIIQQP